MKTENKLKRYREAMDQWIREGIAGVSKYAEPNPRDYGLTLQIELFMAEAVRRNVFVTNGVKHQNQKEKQ